MKRWTKAVKGVRKTTTNNTSTTGGTKTMNLDMGKKAQVSFGRGYSVCLDIVRREDHAQQIRLHRTVTSRASTATTRLTLPAYPFLDIQWKTLTLCLYSAV